ncbi:MAG: hypothetical protein KC493_02515 [Bacteriovoracaceae bacterium]|nr:hypothetical protein [Bacteriovoracaceae bacterium]
MAQNDFRILKVVDSLLLQIKGIEEKIDDEMERISFIESQIISKQKELESCNSILKEIHQNSSQVEKELHEVENEIEKSNSHMLKASSQKEVEALEHEKENLGKKAEDLQETLLNLMEQDELNTTKSKELDEFITGALSSKKDIQQEVDKTTNELSEEIEALQVDWKSDAKNLSDSSKAILKNSLKQFSKSHPFTHLNGNSCKLCGYSLDSTLLRAVEDCKNLEICPGCNRIFIINET